MIQRLPNGFRTARLVRVVCLGLALAAAWPPVARGREIYGLSESELGLYLGSGLLAAWQVGEARRFVDRWLERAPDDPAARAMEARVLFFEGRYAAALEALDELGAEGPFRSLVEATVRATEGFRSRRGRGIVVYWAHPKDEILVDPAMEALEAAREAVARHLGFRPGPDDPVRVEIYPTVAAFTAVSTLTRREVETSGTIGLCKFNRIMLTTPRATLWGYRWRDTLCHEYVHLAVYRLSRGTAPIWVHEGVAKYLEGAWRGDVGRISPAGQALLARRMQEGTLIGLEAMSPSVAKLPSAEDTALAFAEVGTMMAYLVEERGGDALRRLVSALGEGLGDREALERVWGGSFASFQKGWEQWVRSLPLRQEAVEVLGIHLADGGDPDREPGGIRDPEARDYARLGDLLRERGRMEAAAREYAKAYAEAPGSPGIAARHLLGLLEQGAYEEAVSVADRALDAYPDLALLWYRKGVALLALGRPDAALEALDQVLEINPFHLPARMARVSAFRALGEDSAAREEERVVALLSADVER